MKTPKWVWKIVSKFSTRCDTCGTRLKPLNITDMPADTVALHRQAGTLVNLLGYGWRCPDGCMGTKVVMIHP